MRRVANMLGPWRPRTGVAVGLAVVAAAAGGVAWATTGASTAVITACANDAKALFLSTNGSCPSGQTLIRWNEQGPQGAPGPPGTSPPPVRAFGPSSYKRQFSINAEIDQPGDYFIDGSVDLALTPQPAHYGRRSFKAYCGLYSGPPNGSAVEIAHWEVLFRIRKGPVFSPSSVQGEVDVNSVQSLPRTDIPREIYLTCAGGRDAVWTHPAITVEPTTSSVFHQTVGPALPNKPIIGPGPLKKVFGTQ